MMGQLLPLFVVLIFGLLLGAVGVRLLMRGRVSAAEAQARNESQLEIVRLNERLAAHVETIARLQNERNDMAASRDQLSGELQQMLSRVAGLNSTIESERKQNEEKLLLLVEAKEQLSNQFKALANEILEEKSKRFIEQNQTNLGLLLEPLKTKLQEFHGRVEEVYVNESKDRVALAEQVKQLMSLNQQLSQDAHNLTRALRGQSKAQGNWGEMILERILETAGLIKDTHYVTQESHSREDGSRAQPDVVIYLPEGRHLVVDAKVSLTAYEEYVNAETDSGDVGSTPGARNIESRDARHCVSTDIAAGTRNIALKRHLDSMRTHIKELSGRNYQDLYQLKSIDFVLMFVPIEPAFLLAISQDNELWQDAWEKNVLLVSPSTLLFTLRTVAHLWRQEQQTRNAQEIARRGAEIYDKLVGFVNDLDRLGERLMQAQEAYSAAYGKFKSGRGNLIGQAQKLVELGVKPSKQLPQDMVDRLKTEG